MSGVPTTVLAIESAIRGGSVSLIRDDLEVDRWIGSAEVSKAEELLVNIDKMLESKSLSLPDISLVAVSAGPGSFTGIRIGIATALGLKTGLSIPMSSVSALKAIAQDCQFTKDAVVALPVGRNAVCRQRFIREGTSVIETTCPETIRSEEFDEEVIGNPVYTYLLHSFLHDRLGASTNSVDIGENIALAIGRKGLRDPGNAEEPLFISKNW